MQERETSKAQDAERETKLSMQRFEKLKSLSEQDEQCIEDEASPRSPEPESHSHLMMTPEERREGAEARKRLELEVALYDKESKDHHRRRSEYKKSQGYAEGAAEHVLTHRSPGLSGLVGQPRGPGSESPGPGDQPSPLMEGIEGSPADPNSPSRALRRVAEESELARAKAAAEAARLQAEVDSLKSIGMPTVHLEGGGYEAGPLSRSPTGSDGARSRANSTKLGRTKSRESLTDGFQRSDSFSGGDGDDCLHMPLFMQVYMEDLEGLLAQLKDAGDANWGGLGGVNMQLARERETEACTMEMEWSRSLRASAASILEDLEALAGPIAEEQDGVRDWVSGLCESVAMGEGRRVYEAERVASLAGQLQQAEREVAELKVCVEEASLKVASHEAEHHGATGALEKAKSAGHQLEQECARVQRELEAAQQEATKARDAFAKVARRADGLQAEVDGLHRSEAGLTKQVLELKEERNSLQLRCDEAEEEYRKMAEVVGEKSASDDALALVLEEKKHLQESGQRAVEEERRKRVEQESKGEMMEASLLDHARRLREVTEERDELDASLETATAKWEEAMAARDEAKHRAQGLEETLVTLQEKLAASEHSEAALRREMAQAAADQKAREASEAALGKQSALEEEAGRLREAERKLQEEVRRLERGAQEREKRWEAEKSANLRRIREHARIKVEQGVQLQMLSRKAALNDEELREKVSHLERSLQDAEELVRELTRSNVELDVKLAEAQSRQDMMEIDLEIREMEAETPSKTQRVAKMVSPGESRFADREVLKALNPEREGWLAVYFGDAAAKGWRKRLVCLEKTLLYIFTGEEDLEPLIVALQVTAGMLCVRRDYSKGQAGLATHEANPYEPGNSVIRVSLPSREILLAGEDETETDIWHAAIRDSEANMNAEALSGGGGAGPFKVRDEDSVECFSCQTEFSWSRRKHHCRLCGRIFCRPCCDYHVSLPNFDGEVRVCVLCAPRVDATAQPATSVYNTASDIMHNEVLPQIGSLVTPRRA